MNNMYKNIIISVAALFSLGCSPFNKDCVAVCGDDKVWIIDFSKSEGTDREEVWSVNTESDYHEEKK